jgi:cytochrome c peroxidase
MHDGRFKTLEEVLEHYDLHVKTSKTLDPLVMEASNELTKDPAFPHRLYLTTQEKKDIIAFLHTLSDETFINNPLYGDIFNP